MSTFFGVLLIFISIFTRSAHDGRRFSGVISQFLIILGFAGVIYYVAGIQLALISAGINLNLWSRVRCPLPPFNPANPELSAAQERQFRKNWFELSLFEKSFAPMIQFFGTSVFIVGIFWVIIRLASRIFS
jgi:hypothetical protein